MISTPKRLLASATILAAMLCAPAAHAQMSLSSRAEDQTTTVEESVKPPRIETPGKSNTIVALLVTGVTAILCVGLVVLPGRRNYDD